jgi:hypothetical protein
VAARETPPVEAVPGGGSTPETLMGCLPYNPNGPAPGEATYRGGGNPNGAAAPL